MKKSVIYTIDENTSYPKIFFRKIKSFLKVFFSFSINDFYGTLNFLRFRFKIRRNIIRKFKDIHQNQTIFIIGSGPSLDNENLEILNGKILISYNFSFQALKKIKPKKIYSCISGARTNASADLNRSIFDASFRFPGAKEDEIINPKCIKSSDIILPVPYKFYLYKIKDGAGGFSFDISKEFRLSGGSSGLLSCIQLAVYMGANKIVLLGTDFDSQNETKAHFSKANFKKTAQGDLNSVEWYNFKKKDIFEALKRLKNILDNNNIELINASSYTSEKILKKKKLDTFA